MVVNSRIIHGSKQTDWTSWSTFGLDVVVNIQIGCGGKQSD